MSAVRRAVIDVGTNSVKLLVGDVLKGEVTPLLEKSEQTRLGSGFYETCRLQPDAIARTAKAVGAFKTEAAAWKPETIRVIATSAARDALNQADLLTELMRASGLAVEVISGEQEAEWVYLGVTSDPRLADQPLLILDVGGGSTEFIVGERRVSNFRQSFRLGTVRLLESIRPSDPPRETEWHACHSALVDFVAKEIKPALDPALSRIKGGPVQLIGTGGSATILARIQLGLETFDRERLESLSLSQNDIWSQQRRLWSLPIEERRKIVGLPPNRADVILAGVSIFAVVMEAFRSQVLRVSTRGLRFAALM